MAKDLGKYKALDKLKTSLFAIVWEYKESKKFGFRSEVLDQIEIAYDQLTIILKNIDDQP